MCVSEKRLFFWKICTDTKWIIPTQGMFWQNICMSDGFDDCFHQMYDVCCVSLQLQNFPFHPILYGVLGPRFYRGGAQVDGNFVEK